MYLPLLVNIFDHSIGIKAKSYHFGPFKSLSCVLHLVYYASKPPMRKVHDSLSKKTEKVYFFPLMSRGGSSIPSARADA
jgi:hypothetical protein